jgi:hypothetical protein
MTKKLTLERRVAQLEKALKRFSEGLWRVSDEVMVLRKGKHNPQRQALERRVKELENAFFAFQCGAQEQMERDREAIAEAERGAVRDALGAREKAN